MITEVDGGRVTVRPRGPTSVELTYRIGRRICL